MNQSMTKEQAIENLINLGLFYPISSTELYHGRAQIIGEDEWKVDPNFNNADNNTGNFNINIIPALNTGTKEIAESFAIARSKSQKNLKPQIAKINSTDQDALIISASFKYENLDKKEYELYLKSLANLMIPNPTAYVPVKFEDRKNALEIKELAYKIYNNEQIKPYTNKYANYNKLFTIELENKIIKELDKFNPNISETSTKQLISVMNTMALISLFPKYLTQQYIVDTGGFKGITYTFNNKECCCSINREIMSSFLANNNIIGTECLVDSATVGKTITNVILFNLTRINTEKVVGDKLLESLNKYNFLNKIALNMFADFEAIKILQTNSPDKLIEKISKIPNMNQVLNLKSPADNELFVAQQTETALRALNTTYQKDLPPAIDAVMKLSLIIKNIDIGIYTNFDKQDKEQKRTKTNEELYSYLKVDSKVKDIVEFITFDAHNLAYNYFIQGDLTAKKELEYEAKNKLIEIFGKGKATPDNIYGLMCMCEMIQSSTYQILSEYGIIRSENNTYYKSKRKDANDIFNHNEQTQNTTLKYSVIDDNNIIDEIKNI